MRQILQRFVTGNSLLAADQYIHDLEALSLAPNTIAIYDADKGITVDNTVDYSTVPNLGIAQAVDLDGDGIADAWRTVFGGKLEGGTIFNVTTDLPVTGVNKIQDLYFKCILKDESYSVTVYWRNDNTLKRNQFNTWSYETLTAKLSDYACESCDTEIDCTRLACDLANQFNSKFSDSRNSDFLRGAQRLKKQFREIELFPILAKEVQFCFTESAGTCDGCTSIHGTTEFTTMVIDEGGADEYTYTFKNLSTIASAYRKQIVEQANQAFVDAGISGSAFINEGIAGTGRPCMAFSMVINSCKSVAMYDDAVSPIVPCQVEYSPYQTFTKDSECLGCLDGSSVTPNCGLRAVGKAITVNTDQVNKVDRKIWYHTDVRFGVDNYDEFTTYDYTFQDVVIPKGFGLQYASMMLDQEATGTGMDYMPGLVDNTGVYSRPRSGGAYDGNLIGLNRRGLYFSIVFTHGQAWNNETVNGPMNIARAQSYLLIESSETSLIAAVKAILDPWLATLPMPRAPLSTAVDDDQINLTLDTDGTTVTQAPVDETGASGLE